MKTPKIFVTGMLIISSMVMAYCSALMSYMFYTAGLKQGTGVYTLTAMLVTTLESSKYLLATFKFVFTGKVRHVVSVLLNILLVLSIIASINYFMLDTKGYNPASNFVKLLAEYMPIERAARHLTLILNVSLSLVIETLVIKFPQLIPNIWGKQRDVYEPFMLRVSKKLVTYQANRFEAWVDRHVKQEHVKHEPVKHEHVKHEPVKHEHVKQEPVKQEPVKHEHVKQEPVKQEPVKHEHVKQEPVKHEPVKQEPVKQDITEYIKSLGQGTVLNTQEIKDKFNMSRGRWESVRNKLKNEGIITVNSKRKLEVL